MATAQSLPKVEPRLADHADPIVQSLELAHAIKDEADELAFDPFFIRAFESAASKEKKKKNTNRSDAIEDMISVYQQDSKNLMNRTQSSDFYSSYSETMVLESDVPKSAKSSHIPKTIPYPKPCGGLCRSVTPADVLHLQDLLKAYWVHIAQQRSPNKKVSNVGSSDTILCHKCFFGDTVHTNFVGMANGVGQSGIKEAEIGFNYYEPVDPAASSTGYDTLHGLTLKMCRDSYIVPLKAHRSPLHQAIHGVLVNISEDMLSTKCVECVMSEHHVVYASRIEIYVLKWIPDPMVAGFDQCLTQGIDQTFSVTVGGPLPPSLALPARPNTDGVPKATKKAGEVQHSQKEGFFDVIAGLEIPPPAPASKTNKSQTNSSKPKSCNDVHVKVEPTAAKLRHTKKTKAGPDDGAPVRVTTAHIRSL